MARQPYSASVEWLLTSGVVTEPLVPADAVRPRDSSFGAEVQRVRTQPFHNRYVVGVADASSFLLTMTRALYRAGIHVASFWPSLGLRHRHTALSRIRSYGARAVTSLYAIPSR